MTAFGEAEARRILDLGWRQGSTFHVRGRAAEQAGFPEGTLVVVLTQSCTVVSVDLEKDPLVEITTLDRSEEAYRANSDGARGKNMRKLTIPLTEGGAEVAYVVDINARRFIDRTHLMDLAPDGPVSTIGTGERIGRWIASTYARAALPNNLVEFFRKDGFDTAIEKILKAKFEGDPIHGRIRAMFANWSSDEEIDFYELRIEFLCDDELVAMELDDRLQKLFGVELPHVAKTDRIQLQLHVREAGGTFFNEFDNLRRFSRWDFFSGLAESQADGI